MEFGFFVILLLIILFALYYFNALPEDDLQSIRSRAKDFVYDQIPAQYTNLGDITLRYYSSGKDPNKPNIVFIHGIGASMYFGRHIYPRLVKDYNVYALDLPGFGYSSKNTSLSYDLDHQSERVIQWLDGLGVDHFHLVGHSMGGVLSAWIAKQIPDRVQRLTLLAPGFAHRLKYLNYRAVMFLAHLLKNFIVTPRLVEWIHRRNFSKQRPTDFEDIIRNNFLPYYQSPESVITFLKSNDLLGDRRINREFKNFTMPVIVVLGTKDRVVSHRAIRRFLRNNPNAKLVELPGSGHLFPLEEGELTAKLIQGKGVN